MTVALSYIGEHLQEEELSIVQLATQIYLNQVYFGRVFKNTFHMTFKKYLLQQRMEKAKRLIQDGCESIGTVCEQVGISNASYFSHLFKKDYAFINYKRSRHPTASLYIFYNFYF